MDTINIPNSIILKVGLGDVSTLESQAFRASSKMQGKRATHIAVITESQILKFDSLTPVSATGLTGLNVTFFQKGNANTTVIDRLPAAVIGYNSGIESKGFTPVDGQNFDWEESKVNIVDATNLSDNEVFLLLVIYE